MTVTSTPNKGLNQIGTGTESGTWGPYVNNTTGVLDNALGGVVTIPLNNANVVLSSAQYACNTFIFTGALTAGITVTLPAVGSFYTVQNLTTNSSIFQITMRTAAFGGQVIGAPWGEMFGIMTDGSNVKFRNFGRVGSYVDITSATVPAWITACTVPPYLNCNGATFSSAVYPVLRDHLGTTTLPDMRGRTRVSIDNGAGVGPLGDTLFADGGNYQNTIIGSGGVSNIPWQAGSIVSAGSMSGGGSGFYSINGLDFNFTRPGEVPIVTLPPLQVHGVTMIRAG